MTPELYAYILSHEPTRKLMEDDRLDVNDVVKELKHRKFFGSVNWKGEDDYGIWFV